MAKWLSTLEEKLAEHAENSHPDLRVFISAEPAPSPEGHVIPQGILENAIKITNEPPTGMHANLHKALDNFSQVPLGWGMGEAGQTGLGAGRTGAGRTGAGRTGAGRTGRAPHHASDLRFRASSCQEGGKWGDGLWSCVSALGRTSQCPRSTAPLSVPQYTAGGEGEPSLGVCLWQEAWANSAQVSLLRR